MYRLIGFVLLSILSISIKAQNFDCVGDKGKLEWLLFNNIKGKVELNPHYPNGPNEIIEIFKLETEANFNDYYASIIRGFIMTPVSGTYYFNVTGSDYVEFYLSDNEIPENAELLIETDWSSYSQHDRKPEQTDTVELVAGQYYFFELHQRENTGSELARISWKTPFGIDAWQTVGEDYVYSYACNDFCESKGEACNDNNINTINDSFDGFCNCIGEPKQLPECVGEHGKIQALYYDDIEGTDIVDLLNASSYPLQPSRAEYLNQMRLPSQSSHDFFGSTVKAFLKVPLSGSYEFGAIGNSRSELYLSLTGDFSDVVLVANSSGMTTSVELDANRFYYIKIIHKEGQNSEEFAAVWKTPFFSDDEWKYIDDIYLYGFACELACMPEGTPCDDGDENTINDAYDRNCNCSGIYCPDGDCAESVAFEHYESCASTGMHGVHPDDSWLSCNKSESVNEKRDFGHWVQYDLGSVMLVGTSHVWNYNVSNFVEKGFKDVAIDLSLDGENWDEFGIYEWMPASGLNDYKGFEGPDFTGSSARYILITALSNWDGNDCSGFSEIEFKVAQCPLEGTPCDDGDINTENDRYNALCMCKGQIVNSASLLQIGESLKLYPNPSDEWTNIVFYLPEKSVVTIKVFDMTGRLLVVVANRQVYGEGSYQKSLPVHRLKQGQYVVQLSTNKGIITKKLVVSK